MHSSLPRRRTSSSILLSAVVALGLAVGGCGGGDTETAAGDRGFVVQGEQNIELESTTTTAAPTEEAAGGAGEADGGSDPVVPTFDETGSTVPTNEEDDPDGEFFDAVGEFMSCLSTEGYEFIGIPSESLDATAPANDPGYIEALQGCAASSQIVSKMQAAEDTSNLSAEEIEENNRAFSEFVDCLKGRGWDIPEPTPDENGSLQPPYVEIAQTWIPPDGTSILADNSINTDDFAECGITPDALN